MLNFVSFIVADQNFMIDTEDCDITDDTITLKIFDDSSRDLTTMIKSQIERQKDGHKFLLTINKDTYSNCWFKNTNFNESIINVIIIFEQKL